MESFNARLRDELLNGESFYTLREAQVVIGSWRRALQQGEAAWLAWLPIAGVGSRGAGAGYADSPDAWQSVAYPGCSDKPCQVFIGANIVDKLTFGWTTPWGQVKNLGDCA